MLDSGTLFWLILAALILINTCLFAIVYLMVTDEKNKSKGKRSSVAEKETTQECLHFFGYLAEAHPRNQPIPKECFGCTLAFECLKNTKENIVEVKAQT